MKSAFDIQKKISKEKVHYTNEDIFSEFFLDIWKDVLSGKLVPYRVVVDNNYDIFFTEEEEAVPPGDFLEKGHILQLAYKKLQKGILTGSVWVLDTDELKIVMSGTASIEDWLNRLDTHDALMKLKEAKEQYIDYK